MRNLWHRLVVWWRLLGRKNMQNVCVGVRNDASIDVDMAEQDEDEEKGWDFHNLSIEEAEFLRDELSSAIDRARARRAVLDARKPPAPAQPDQSPTA